MRFQPAQDFLPGLAPPRPARDPARDMLRTEQIAEECAACIPWLKASHAPITLADIARCRADIVLMLHDYRLPVPSDDFLDKLIAELCWFHDFPLAPNVLALADIETLDEPPRKTSRGPSYDGPAVGWDPWNDVD